MRLTTAAVEGLKLDTRRRRQDCFRRRRSGLRHSRARQRRADVDLSVQDRGQDQAACSWTRYRRSSLLAREKLPANCTPRCAWAVILLPKSGRRYSARSTRSAHWRNGFWSSIARGPGTRDEVVRHLRKYAAPLHPMPVDAITLRDVADLLTKIDKASGAVYRQPRSLPHCRLASLGLCGRVWRFPTQSCEHEQA